MNVMPESETASPVDLAVNAANARYLRGEAIDMSTLANELGWSRATLYRRVGNHEELMGRVLERQTESSFRRASAAPGLTGTDAVISRFERFISAVVNARPLRAFIERDPILFVRVVMGPGRVESMAIRLVEDLMTAELGAQLQLDSAVLARALVRVCDSFMYSHLLSNTEPELHAAISVVRLLLSSAQQNPDSAHDVPSVDGGRDVAFAELAPSGYDSGKMGILPTTERGRRTRQQLLVAARRVFERVGYQDARLVDITGEARCAIGTFYTYFNSKDEIFSAVLEFAQEDMLHPGTGQVPGSSDAYTVIEASNRSYFESYRQNAKLMVALEQVAHVDGQFRELRRRRSSTFVRRNARSIEQLQAAGLADPDLDALSASRALSGMVSRLAYGNFAYEDGEDGEGVLTLDELVDTATRLWSNALRLGARTPDSDKSSGGSRAALT
jgi:AcrR family transcriptional regulator